MSLVKSKAIQLGFDATPTNNFLIYQPLTPDGTFRIANGNQGATTDIMTVTSGGSVTFAGTTNFSSLNFGAGSESAPSLFPTGDSNTGIWFPAADTFAVSTGGAERLRIDSSGRTTLKTSAYNYLLIDSTASDSYLRLASNATAKWYFRNNVSGSHRLEITPDAGTSTGLFIQQNGAIGIGTASPLTNFDVNKANAGGDVSMAITNDNGYTNTSSTATLYLGATDNSLANSSKIVASHVGGTTGDHAQNMQFWTVDAGSTPVERLRIKADGGIVHYGTSNAEITSLATHATSSALMLRPWTSSSWALSFGSMSGNRMSLQAMDAAGTQTRELVLNPFGGNVGVGTTLPYGKFHAMDTIQNGTANFYLDNRHTYSASQYGKTRLSLAVTEAGYTDPSTRTMGYVEASHISDSDSSFGYLALGTRTSSVSKERLRVASNNSLGYVTSYLTDAGTIGNNYIIREIEQFNFGAGSITDEYMLLCPNPGSNSAAYVISGEIISSRGSVTSGNSFAIDEIIVTRAYNFFNASISARAGSTYSMFKEIVTCTYAGNPWLAVKVRGDGGQAHNGIFFKGYVTNESADTFKRVRSSDLTNVVTVRYGQGYSSSFQSGSVSGVSNNFTIYLDPLSVPGWKKAIVNVRGRHDSGVANGYASFGISGVGGVNVERVVKTFMANATEAFSSSGGSDQWVRLNAGSTTIDHSTDWSGTFTLSNALYYRPSCIFDFSYTHSTVGIARSVGTASYSGGSGGSAYAWSYLNFDFDLASGTQNMWADWSVEYIY